MPFRARLAIVFAAAALTVLMILGCLHLAGYRYIICSREDGTEIKFVGRVDASGDLLEGTIVYSATLSAKVDKETGDIKYSNGSVFSGKLNEKFERSGHGTLTLGNGDKVTGDFACDILYGYAKYEYSNGDVFEGYFVNNVKQGTGKYTYADGEIYEGSFNLDMRHGEGKTVKSDGTSYEGTYEMGMKWGKGKITYPNGDTYEGDFEYDMRHGSGVYTWADGEKYEGEFANNNINGYGTYTWTTGRASYTGYFRNGEIVLEDENTVLENLQKTAG